MLYEITKKKLLRIPVLCFCLSLLLLNGAEAGMRDTYPKKFSFTGLVELIYTDFSSKQEAGGLKSERKRSEFLQQYSLGLEGFIYDPRLVVFFSRVTLRTDSAEDGGSSKGESSSKNVNYDLSVTFLPYRPVSFSIYGNKTDSTFDGTFISSYEASAISYGAMLKVDRKKWPLIKLEYNHWDYDSGLSADEISSDRYELDVRGSIKAANTRYLLNLEHSDYASSAGSFTSQQLRGYADTSIKKAAVLRSNLYYSGIEFSDNNSSRLFNLDLDLDVNPYERFAHYYTYAFSRAEYYSVKTDDHKLRAGWTYRFSDQLTGNMSASAGITERGGESPGGKSDFYSFGSGLSYWKHFAGLAFRSSYNVTHRKDNAEDTTDDLRQSGTFHNFGLYVATRKLSFGTIFSEYDFFNMDSDSGASTVHALRSGIRGKGPGRVYWKLEGEYRNVKGESVTTERDIVNIPGTDQGSFYTAYGEIRAPLGRKGQAVFNSWYSITENDGAERKYFYYDVRLNYRIMKNLSAMLWWRDARETNVTDDSRRDTTDLNLNLFYKFRRLFFSAEYRLQKVRETSASSENSSIFLRLRRPF